MFKRPRITDPAYDPSRFGGSPRAALAAYLLDEERHRVRGLLARWLIAGAAVVAALLVAGFVLAGCSAVDEPLVFSDVPRPLPRAEQGAARLRERVQLPQHHDHGGALTMRQVILLLIVGAALAACSSSDNFSDCVKRCMGARDPLPGGECVRLCERYLEPGHGDEARSTEGGE